MIQKIIKPPMIDAQFYTRHDNSSGFPNDKNDLLRIGTKFGTHCRTLMKFDLSSLPFFSIIHSCTLHIFVAQNEFLDCFNLLGVFQVLSEWNAKTITYNEPPLLHTSPIDSISVTKQTDVFLSFNITELLQDWFSKRAANLGVMLQFINESPGNLLAISGKNYHDSRCWPYLELQIVDPVTMNARSALRATLDQSVTVVTQDSIQCTASLTILIYDYSYLVVNTGANVAVAYLQISPDGVTWETQSAPELISPNTIVSFVSNVIAKYARLCYQSQQLSDATTLKIYIQGR